MLRSNNKSLGNHVISPEEKKERLQWEGCAEKEGCKPGMKEWVSDGKLIIISMTVSSNRICFTRSPSILMDTRSYAVFVCAYSMNASAHNRVCSRKRKRNRNVLTNILSAVTVFSVDRSTVSRRAHDNVKKVKVAHTQLPSVGFRSWSPCLAVSLQVTWVINPAVGCHYFPPGLQLPPQHLRGLLPISMLGEQRHDGCEQFA